MAEIEPQLVDKGTMSDDISRAEVHFQEGDTGEVVFFTTRELFDYELQAIENRLVDQGVVLNGLVLYSNRMLVVPFRKAIAPLIIIGLAVGAIISGLMGWEIFKTVKAGVPTWVWIGGAILVLILLFQPAKEAAPTIIQLVGPGKAAKVLKGGS